MEHAQYTGNQPCKTEIDRCFSGYACKHLATNRHRPRPAVPSTGLPAGAAAPVVRHPVPRLASLGVDASTCLTTPSSPWSVNRVTRRSMDSVNSSANAASSLLIITIFCPAALRRVSLRKYWRPSMMTGNSWLSYSVASPDSTGSLKLKLAPPLESGSGKVHGAEKRQQQCPGGHCNKLLTGKC
jgi:hypothetical protein